MTHCAGDQSKITAAVQKGNFKTAGRVKRHHNHGGKANHCHFAEDS
jgi:hypothetical protein